MTASQKVIFDFRDAVAHYLLSLEKQYSLRITLYILIIRL